VESESSFLNPSHLPTVSQIYLTLVQTYQDKNLVGMDQVQKLVTLFMHWELFSLLENLLVPLRVGQISQIISSSAFDQLLLLGSSFACVKR
jgi:hypothetical protein